MKEWRASLPRPVTSPTERMKMSRAQIRALDAEARQYPVHRLIDQPPDKWPPNPPAKLIRAQRNRDFAVMTFAEAEGVIRLSINRVAVDPDTGRWKDGISWDDLQQLKALAGYASACAVELYPPDDATVNVANMRHLWILPEPPAFMWKGGE